MKSKCILYGLLLGLLSTVLLTGSSASAITPYDDLVKQHPTFSVDYDSFSAEWLTEPVSFSNMDDLYNNIDFCGDQSNFCQYLTELKDRIDNHGSKNIIVQSMPMSFPHDGRTYMLQMTMYDINEEFEFGMYNGNYATLIAKKNLQRKQITIGYNSHWTIGGIYTEGSNNQKPYVTNATYVDLGYPIVFSNLDIPEYPEGYEGELVNGGGAGAKAKLPNITYQYNDLALEFYSDENKNTAVLENYKIYWFASNTTTDEVQPDEHWAVSGCTEPQFMNMHNLPAYADYGIQAYYADEDCNILNKDDEGTVLAQNMVVITIDGSIGGGSTTEDNAAIEEQNELILAIRRMNLMDNTLTALILAPLQLIANMATYNGSCSSINMPFIQDKSMTFTCIRPMVQSNFPSLYMTIATITTGFITIHVAIRTFGLAKAAATPDTSDRIEVTKL